MEARARSTIQGRSIYMSSGPFHLSPSNKNNELGSERSPIRNLLSEREKVKSI